MIWMITGLCDWLTVYVVAKLTSYLPMAGIETVVAKYSGWLKLGENSLISVRMRMKETEDSRGGAPRSVAMTNTWRSSGGVVWEEERVN